MWEDLDHDRFFSDPSRRPRRGLVIVASIVVSAATVAALYFTVGPTNTQRVPALVGLPLHEALLLARNGGVRLVVSGSEPDPLVTKGAVASQSPLAGSEVPGGATVKVVLSDGLTAPRGHPLVDPDAGPPQHTVGTTPPSSKRAAPVPRLLGLRLNDARRKLNRSGLATGRVSYGIDEDRMDQRILRQAPQPGTRVALGTTVDLVVNNTSGL